MKIAAIVVEYNPFHNGHLYQINEIKKQLQVDHIVVVMSGHFTQRGNPCVTDKFMRSQMALNAGVDLVLELPTPFATSSAEFFAKAAVNILDKSGIVDYLCFGCETPNLELLTKVSTTLAKEPLELSSGIKELLQDGVAYPKARQMALTNYLRSELTDEAIKDLDALLSNPNNILAIEYMKALSQANATIEPFPMQRIVSNYHDQVIEHTIASATAIRNHLEAKDYASVFSAMPTMQAQLLVDHYKPLINLDDYTQAFHHKIIFSSIDDLYALWDIPKNLINSLVNASQKYWLISDILNEVTSKTYSRATVSRAILRILLGVEKSFIDQLASRDYTPYIRILACSNEAKNLLSYLSEKAGVPIVANFQKFFNDKNVDGISHKLLLLESQASSLYALGKRDQDLHNCDFKNSLFTKKTTL